MRSTSSNLVRRLLALGLCLVAVASQCGCVHTHRARYEFLNYATFVLPGTIVNKGRASYDSHNFNPNAKYKPYPHSTPAMYYEPVTAESVPAPEPATDPTPDAATP